MNIYNIVLAFILMLVNWLIFSTYFNIYIVYKKVDNYPDPKKIFSINLIALLFYFFIYLLASIYFEFNSIKSFEIISFVFLHFFIFSMLLFFSLFIYLIEKINIIHLILVVFFSILIISFIYPFLLQIAFEKYE
tara:strand:+ start:8832 stop:9233 length:402 start_codon:yes stop_codon:yes gene_type:complete